MDIQCVAINKIYDFVKLDRYVLISKDQHARVGLVLTCLLIQQI